MQMRFRGVMMWVALTAGWLAPGLAFSEDAAQPASEAPEVTAAPAPAESDAVALLRRVEAAHAATKTLHARFNQVREDSYFGDSFASQGEFWYAAPDRFRATYKDRNPSEIWMVDGKLINYVPGNRQVDIVPMPQGEDAPVNQLLLGFGAKVERIQEIFDVTPAAEPRPGLVGIDFTSRDLARSMEYNSISIYFVEESLEPRIIVARDPLNVITVEMTRVRVNPTVDDKVFETKWPDRTVVINHGGE